MSWYAGVEGLAYELADEVKEARWHIPVDAQPSMSHDHGVCVRHCAALMLCIVF